MPSRGQKFISEFLLPSLNEKRFGSRLMWLDIENKVFQIQWNHKSSSDWTTSDAAVFAAWDQRKGHYNPDDKEYYPKSKQRFRAALYKFIKLNHITELCSEDRYTKIYCIGDGKNISIVHNTVDKSVKENDGKENRSQMEMKQSPDDLVTNRDFNWNADLLLTVPQEDYFVYNHEIKKEDIFKKELAVTDCIHELSPEIFHFDALQNYINFLNFSSDIKENFNTKEEDSNILKEDDIKLLHVDESIESKTSICNKDNHLKNVITIENNFHEYACVVMGNSRQKEWSEIGLHETDEELNSFDLRHECNY